MISTDGQSTDDLLVVNRELSIPTSELQFRFSRSSGPGGQHVNRSETRVELLFDIQKSPSLTEEQRMRLLQRLVRLIDGQGIMHLVSSETRSQFDNRTRVTDRFQMLLAAALRRRKHRIPTAPSATSRNRRIAHKKARSVIKQSRRHSASQDYD
jgi:ribosome-associated protein